MADNYLEKRMDDYRAGRLGVKQRRPACSSAGIPADAIIHRLPPLRILVAGLPAPLLDAVASAFLERRCKVAVFTGDAALGQQLAHDKGARHCPFDGPVAAGDIMTRHLDRLLHDWRNLDIIVATPALAPALLEAWTAHNTRYPIPTDYRPRIITVAPEDDTVQVNTTNPEVLIYHIISPDTAATSLASLALFLSLPSTTYLNSPSTLFIN